MSPAARVAVSGLRVRFGEVDAVRDVDVTVGPGGAVALVGRNGAGKSTTLLVLAGVLPASGGSVVVDGVDVRRDPTAAKRVTGYCPDVGGLLPRATPWEHLQLAAGLLGAELEIGRGGASLPRHRRASGSTVWHQRCSSTTCVASPPRTSDSGSPVTSTTAWPRPADQGPASSCCSR